jgi:hypothetical protein
MYGKPVFGREGMALPPISAKELSAELVSALENLPRAEIVQDRSDVPRVGRTYLIRSAYSRKCLGVQDAPGLEGASVVQRAASESRIHWKLTKTGNAFRLVNTANGLVLDAAGSGPVMQRQPSRSATQVWSFIKSGDLYHIRCRESGRVLDVADNSTDDGATITTWSLNQPASANQLWIFTEVGEANARLQSRRTNQN